MLTTHDIQTLMSVLRSEQCPYCFGLTVDRAQHTKVCFLRPEAETPDELAQLVARERFGRPPGEPL